MRVNIQYSVDIDEIPLEIQNLIQTTVVERLHAVVEGLSDLSCEDNPEQALVTIDEARKALFSADERLSDLDGILRGYIVQRAALLQSQSEVQAEPNAAVPESLSHPGETGKAVITPASEDTMAMVRQTLAAHRAETDALRSMVNEVHDED